jgi:hypothetical protein
MSSKLLEAGFNATGFRMRDPKLHGFLRAWHKRWIASNGHRILMPTEGASLIIGIGDTPEDARYLSVAKSVVDSGFDCAGRALGDMKTPSEEFLRAVIKEAVSTRAPCFAWCDFKNTSGEVGEFEMLAMPVGNLVRPRALLVVEAMRGHTVEETPEFLRGEIKEPKARSETFDMDTALARFLEDA